MQLYLMFIEDIKILHTDSDTNVRGFFYSFKNFEFSGMSHEEQFNIFEILNYFFSHYI